VTASSSPAPKPAPRPPRHAAGSSSGGATAADAPTATPAGPATSTSKHTAPAAETRPTSSSATAMNGKTAAEPSVGQLVADASTHLSTLIRGEIALAKIELRSSVKSGGIGVVALVIAAVVGLFSLVFGFLTLAEGLAAIGLDRWLAFLIVFLFQLVIVGLLVFIGIKKMKKVKAPARTIKSTRDTVDYLKKSRG
jgi:Putative Actinobacterial Holin-X, holin superfamily III